MSGAIGEGCKGQDLPSVALKCVLRRSPTCGRAACISHFHQVCTRVFTRVLFSQDSDSDEVPDNYDAFQGRHRASEQRSTLPASGRRCEEKRLHLVTISAPCEVNESGTLVWRTWRNLTCWDFFKVTASREILNKKDKSLTCMEGF